MNIKFAAAQPPYAVPIIPREEVIRMSDEVLARPDIPITIKEDIFRIKVAAMDWDIGVRVYEPEDSSNIPRGPEGNRIGFFILHGGDSDFRLHDRNGRILAGKFGYKVVIMTYPGRLYLHDPSRKWPGETIYPDGTLRTPIWAKESIITRDQYDTIRDLSKRDVYGTMTFARAKEGAEFYHRLAAWPWAFEEAMKTACHRHLPQGEFSIYAHGHSTGGPFSFILSQRVANVVGIAGCENTPFGYIFSKMINVSWDDMPFNEVRVMDWRDQARLYGHIVLKREGPKAFMCLARIMEEVLEEWEGKKDRPNFRVESLIHHNGVKPLEQAARVTAKRLQMNEQETEALVKQFTGYTRELSGPGVKPVPPYLQIISKVSRNHEPEFYTDVAMPMFAAMNPPPKVLVLQAGAGKHMYMEPEEAALPDGLCPVAAYIYNQAIMSGYYEDYARQWAR